MGIGSGGGGEEVEGGDVGESIRLVVDASEIRRLAFLTGKKSWWVFVVAESDSQERPVHQWVVYM